MKNLILLTCLSLLATSSSAVLDPEPDIMGIYFDLNADNNCLASQPASVPFMAYIILTNPTAPSINAYELGYELVVPAGMEDKIYRLSDTIANGVVSGINAGDASQVLTGDYVVGLASPLPGTPATVLHSMQYLLLETIWVEWYLGASAHPSIPGDYPVVQDAEGSVLIQARLLAGSPEWPVANANLGCIDETEAFSFGKVKSLFR